MQRLRRLQTPRLYQDRLLHLESLTAAHLVCHHPRRKRLLRLEFGIFSLSMPSRAEATVCPHRGRGELGSEDQRRQRGSRIELLDFLGFGPPTAAAKGPRDFPLKVQLPGKSGRRRWVLPRETRWVRRGIWGCPASPDGHGGQVPLCPLLSLRFAAEAARCAAFFSVIGGAEPRALHSLHLFH